MIEQLLALAQQEFASNDLLTGGVGIAAFSAALYQLRAVPGMIWKFVQLQLVIHLTVYNEDEAFGWINEWLAAQPYVKRCRRLSLSSFWKDNDEAWSLAPGPGNHLVWYGTRPMWLERSVNEASTAAKRRETITIRMFGRDPDTMRRLVEEARGMRNYSTQVSVYTWHHGWCLTVRKPPRGLDSIVLPPGVRESLVADAEWFESAGDWYAERGIPYRRGYLLFGPPGCGKTSLAFALASHLGRPIYLLNLASILGDRALSEAFQQLPSEAILLIEDIDATGTTKRRKKRKSDEDLDDGLDETGSVSLSALLNAIDGVAAADGRILIMTTNHRERLDPALIRPGRADREFEIPLLGRDEIFRMHQRFFPGRPVQIGPDPVSAATLQGVFMQFSDDPLAAAHAITALTTVGERAITGGEGGNAC